jgi:hypothetical protein
MHALVALGSLVVEIMGTAIVLQTSAAESLGAKVLEILTTATPCAVHAAWALRRSHRQSFDQFIEDETRRLA